VRVPAAVLTLLILAAGCRSADEPGESQRGRATEVRVRLQSASAARSVRIAVPGPYRLREEATGRETESGSSLDRRVELGSAKLPRALRLQTDGAPIRVDGSPYPGDLLLLPREGGVDLVVVTDLEAYLPGVLAKEMGAAFPAAALRAQAVAARTYALDVMRGRGRKEGYDLRDDTSDQAYAGLVEASGGPLTRAVAATRGMVLTFRSAPFRAYYSSTCGGHTADKVEVFGGPPFPPLSAVPCVWCRGESRYYRWTQELPLETVRTRLGLPGSPRAVAVSKRGRGRRALRIKLYAPEAVEMDAAEVRRRLGYGVLRSTMLFETTVSGGLLVVKGGGWGHGVGMCQCGAKGMAKAGASAADILSHYYPGAELTRLY